MNKKKESTEYMLIPLEKTNDSISETDIESIYSRYFLQLNNYY